MKPATSTAATSRSNTVLQKIAQRAGIEHAKQNDSRAYLGRKPSYTREQFHTVRAMLGRETVGIAQIAKDTGLTRQTVYRIKDDPASAEAALSTWGLPPDSCPSTDRPATVGMGHFRTPAVQQRCCD